MTALVKICGVRAVRHAQVAAEAGAEMVGLVFAESRRRVTPAEAHGITSAAYQRRPRFVGVFVNEEPETMARLAGEARLDLVQLSGDEAPELCANLRVPYMKVIHVRGAMTPDEVLERAAGYPNAAAIVLDTAGNGATQWGGTGVPMDLNLAAEVVRRIGRPVVFAGGLRPETVAAAVSIVRPWAVDVSSGVESDGLKDEAKIAAFVRAAKEAERSEG